MINFRMCLTAEVEDLGRLNKEYMNEKTLAYLALRLSTLLHSTKCDVKFTLHGTDVYLEYDEEYDRIMKKLEAVYEPFAESTLCFPT